MLNTELSTNTRVTDEAPTVVGPLVPFPWGQVLHGDCLQVAAALPPGQIDLLYIDPPFFTNREQTAEVRPRGRAKMASNAAGEKAAFTDSWKGGMAAYLLWLEERVRVLKPLLKPTGVFLLHLDWHAVHYAKVMCDTLFGADRFENEIIWYYQTGGASKDRFSRKHDTILLYSMSGVFYFDGRAVAIPRTAKAMKRAQCATGARIKATDTHKNPDDVLTVPALNPMATEREGYPTQKPVALLETLIKALCPPASQGCENGKEEGEIGGVGDFFCGSGTTLVAARKLGRRWVGCDASRTAVELARRRLEELEQNLFHNTRSP